MRVVIFCDDHNVVPLMNDAEYKESWWVEAR